MLYKCFTYCRGSSNGLFALANVTDSGSFIDGLRFVYEKAPERFSMILSKGEIITPNGKDAWWDLPGLAVIIGGGGLQIYIIGDLINILFKELWQQKV